MRIDGVSPAAAARRELRRSDPGEADKRDRFGFSPDGFILDLTLEALRWTRRGGGASARRFHSPPESYDATGGLAYSDPPEHRAPPTEIVPEPEAVNPPPPVVAFVAFDGMLRSVYRDF